MLVIIYNLLIASVLSKWVCGFRFRALGSGNGLVGAKGLVGARVGRGGRVGTRGCSDRVSGVGVSVFVYSYGVLGCSNRCCGCRVRVTESRYGGHVRVSVM